MYSLYPNPQAGIPFEHLIFLNNGDGTFRDHSTASGLRMGARELGGVGGLALVSVLFGVVGSNWIAIVLLCGVSLIAPLLVLLTFPETAGRTLEEISPEALVE